MSGIAIPQSIVAKNPIFSASAINSKDRQNWLAHILFLRQDFTECLKLVDEVIESSDGRSEYALYLKALILRLKGKIH